MVFISYSSLDSSTAEYICKILKENQIDCWMAPESIPGGSDYAYEIVNAIESCNHFLLILSQNSQKSEWVPKELDIAIDAKKYIIPINIDGSSFERKLRLRLSNVQCLSIGKSLDEVISSIVQQINNIHNEYSSSDRLRSDKDCSLSMNELNEFTNCISDLFNDTVFYRNALKIGNQEQFNQASYKMTGRLQELYYFCERNKFNKN